MTTPNNEVMVYDKFRTPEPLSVDDIRRNTVLIRQALKEVMVRDVDFGLIPGCGDKPGLFKPGAEKLMFLFKLGCFVEPTEHRDHDCIRYVVKTRIVHIPSGIELGTGVGSCSSDEEKYKWKKATGPKHFEATPEERRRKKFGKGKDGKEFEILQVRTEPADLDNTILKMAAKRSKVDAVISCTAASDILSQGEDDNFHGEVTDDLKSVASKPVQKPADTEERIVPESFRSMKSKYASSCKFCEKPIAKGEDIEYRANDGAYHPPCAKEAVSIEAK